MQCLSGELSVRTCTAPAAALPRVRLIPLDIFVCYRQLQTIRFKLQRQEKVWEIGLVVTDLVVQYKNRNQKHTYNKLIEKEDYQMTLISTQQKHQRV